MQKFKEWCTTVAPKVLGFIWAATVFIGSAALLLWVISMFIKQIGAMGW